MAPSGCCWPEYRMNFQETIFLQDIAVQHAGIVRSIRLAPRDIGRHLKT